MKVTVEQSGPCRRVLKIEVPAETVAAEYRGIVAEFAKHARIPGFRPGKAPAAIVEKRFSKDALEETHERLVPRAYHEAVAAEKLKPVAIVDVSDIHIEKQMPLSFRVTVDVEPEFSLPAYKGIPLASRKVEVAGSEVDRVIDSLRERAAKLETVTGRPARKGDVVEIDYSGACDGQPLSELAKEHAGLGEGKDFWVLLGDGPEFLPGLAAQLEGIEIGQTREAKIDFPKDYRVGLVAGRSAVYNVTARGIRERQIPELDADFLKTLGVESADVLKKRVEENLLEAAQATERNRQRDEVIRWLGANTEIKDLPQSLVEQEARHIINDVVQANVRRGASKEEIESHREDIFTRASESSADRVRTDYILERIAEVESIEVTEAEVDQRIRVLATRGGVAPQRLRADIEERGRLDDVRRSIRMEKAVDAVLAAAVLVPEQQGEVKA